MFRAGSHAGSIHEINAFFIIFVNCAVDNGVAWFSWDKLSSRRSLIRGITLRRDYEKAMYLISLVEIAISVYSFDAQMIGQLALNMM